MVEQHMIHFLYGPAGLSDAQAGTTLRNQQAAAVLKKLVDDLKVERDRVAQQDKMDGGKGELEPIVIVGYSNGSIVTKLALEQGMKVDGVVFTGSAVPAAHDMTGAMKGTPYLRNYYSMDDGTVEWVSGAGRYGFYTKVPGLLNEQFADVKHYVDDNLKTAGADGKYGRFFPKTEWTSKYMGQNYYAPVLQTSVGTLSAFYNQKAGGRTSLYQSGVR